MKKIQKNHNTFSAVETISTYHNSAKEVPDVLSRDIALEKGDTQIEPDSLDGLKSCDRDIAHKKTTKRRSGVYYVGPGGVVIFDPQEVADVADSIRHNR